MEAHSLDQSETDRKPIAASKNDDTASAEDVGHSGTRQVP
jgi:hypothetical protein